MVYQVSDIYPLHSGRQTRSLATTLCMSANLIFLLDQMSNLFLRQNTTPAYIPQAKAWGLGGKIDKQF